MKKMFTENLGLKALALAFSFALWIVVVNLDDPVISSTYNGVKVEILNEKSLTDKGKVYEVLSGTDTISVTVTGKRSVVESIGKENIIATADLNDLTLVDTVAIKVETNKNNDQLDSIKSDLDAVSLNIENLMVTHMPLTVEVVGTPAKGYIVGDTVTNQNTVRISGPESDVKAIESACITVNVNDRVSDITTMSDIVMFDYDGNIVSNPNISINIKTINVSTTILATKAVDIEYSYSGETAEGYAVNGDVIPSRKAVYIAGRQSALDGVSSIQVPSQAINVDNKNESFSQEINLKDYLPEGVRFADNDFDGRVVVDVNIDKTLKKVMSVNLRNIRLDNIPEGYSAVVFGNNSDVHEEPVTGTVFLKVPTEGISGLYTGFSDDDIKGSIDVSGNLESTGRKAADGSLYQMEIVYELPDGIKLTEKCYADVRLVMDSKQKEENH